ncbi:hypothetical protein PISMIDRAFT_9547 [Pisolithus microcarpus 441]|uniref:Uncharacterized protein n=1 Tax=Pisolithus microcarpus 441 TaxID=765257 RepID=A0A0C9Z8C9_9AGAM|nr:hypothetical protein PISMIDRAFT_9547 [Pisolithus microcarpus 441]
MSTATNPVLSRVLQARERLMVSGLYLGQSCTASNLEWVREGRGHVLSHIPAPPINVTATTSDEEQRPPSDLPTPSDFCAPPERAVLSAIVRIDRDDFWLVSNGGYQGAGSVWKDILDVKPSCALTKPGMQPLDADFATVMTTLRLLTNKCVTPGYALGKSLFGDENLNPKRFKLRHKLFESLDTDVDNDDVEPPSATDPFSLEMWPLTKERNRPELLALKSTHRVLPVPAYDLAGNLIHPTAYRRFLQGALVEIHFTLSHWGIAGVRRDVYSGEIQFIHLLDAPIPASCAGRKRRIPLHLNADSTPSKKQVTG